MTIGVTDETPSHGVCYVITLRSTSVPMPLEVPFVHELVCFSVFRSRDIDDGRERFRQHVGYFQSRARAYEALAVIRRYYPAAWISEAPAGDQSSLDDTLNTSFLVIKSANARVVAQHAASYSQRYVIQLDWSTVPIDVEAVPRLAALHPYNLYTVRSMREGCHSFGLRLGFFKNLKQARQVVEACSAHYPRSTVLPISHREYLRAVDVVKTRGHERSGSEVSYAQ